MEVSRLKRAVPRRSDLITTLPSPDKRELIEHVLSSPAMVGARYNVGIRSSYSPMAALSYIKRLADKNGKKLWLDLKGRQLRITKWADPTYGDIELNHPFEVDLPAKIVFRGNHWSNVVGYDGNKIFIDPDPKYALGAGQAVNIIGTNLRITGDYFTERDREHIKAAKILGIHNYMLSFVEGPDDIEDLLALDNDAMMYLKIESQKGMRFVESGYTKQDGIGLIAARDDLMINIGDNKAMILGALETILKKDPDAVAASHIFNSLPAIGYPSMADFSDLKMLHDMGYHHFMLSDEVSMRYFDDAVKAWTDFTEYYHG